MIENSVVVRPAKSLSGSMRLPGDKSISHRYAMLGVLDEEGFPVREMGILQVPETASATQAPTMAGARCPECAHTSD